MDDTQVIINKIQETKIRLKAAKKAAYSDNLYLFNKDVLGWPDLYEPLHKKVCDFVQDNYLKKKILLLLPRGTFKSSIITVGFALWQIARDSNVRILLANATYPMATSFLGQIKKHIQGNEVFKEIFGEMYVPTEKWSQDRISVSSEKLTHKEPTIWAYGMGGNLVGSHFNIAILDDVVARDNIGTKDQIEKTKNFFRDALDLLDPKPDGHKPMIIIGTTWHWDDLYSWIMDKRNNLINDFAVMKLPAYTGEWQKGELLFPKRLTWDTLQKLKDQQGQYHFSAQYLLNPVPEADQTFKPPFQTYEETDIRGMEMNTFMSIDPALSENEKADFSAIVVIQVDVNNTWYIRDIWRGQVQPSELINMIFIKDQQWKPTTIALESTSFQRILQYQVFDEMKKRGRFIPIKEIKHAGMNADSKEDRIRSLQPRYETKTVFHPERNAVPLVEYLEDELMRFPRGKNDDMVDALATMNEIAFARRVKEERGGLHQAHYPA
jgi:predicted phage terminase large subunit-like protein